MTSSVSILTACLALMLLSVLTVSLINQFQSRNRLLRHRVESLRRKISDLEELCAAVEPLLETVMIPKLINDEVIHLIQAVRQLDPSTTYLDLHLDQAQNLARELSNDRRTQPLYRLMSSDAAIAKSKFYIIEAAKVMRKLNAHGIIQHSELEAFIRELSWAHLMVGVISHVGHGHKAVTRGDNVVAYSFYRKAQNMLINGNIDEQRRHRFIREIGEILSNKRVALSLELMPESDFNPEKNVMKLPNDAATASGSANPNSDSMAANS